MITDSTESDVDSDSLSESQELMKNQIFKVIKFPAQKKKNVIKFPTTIPLA